MVDTDVAAAQTLPERAWQPAAANLSALLDTRLREHGHRPLLTSVDEVGGERTELGYATAENWVSKTANLLHEELGVERGDAIAVALEGHWTEAVVALACWKVGAVVVDLDSVGTADCRAAVVMEDRAPAVDVDGEVIAVGRGMAARTTGEVGAALAYGEEVLAFADHFDDPDVDAADTAVVVADPAIGSIRLSQANLLAAAEVVADWWPLDADDRLLTQRLDPLARWVLALLPALHAGGSVLAVTGADAESFVRQAGQERATAAVVGADALGGLRTAFDDAGAVPASLRGVCATAPPDPAALAALPVPTGYGTGLVHGTLAAAFAPRHLDDATRAWLDARDDRLLGAPTHLAQIAAFDDGGVLVPRGEVGGLRLRGPLVAAGMDAADGANRYAGGWLDLGVAGTIDAGPDGRVYAFVR